MTRSPDQAKFLDGNLTQHIVTMSLTAAVGFVALFIVDLVDMLFISMLGVEALAAAVGFAGSILFMTTSICIGVGIAGGALVAKSLGENRSDRASELLTHVLIAGVVFSIGFAGLIYSNLNALTALIGATGETQVQAIAYLQIVIPTMPMPMLMIGMVVSAALRGHGAARLSMFVTLTAGLVNAILDPILIFALGMGLEGAAWASAAARVSMSVAGVWFITRRYGGFTWLSLPALVSDLKPIAAIAIPAMLANVAAPVGAAYVTKAAADFGEAAVAGMAIIGRITPVAFALIFAMSGSIGPIIGQNFGAGQHRRVRETYNSSIVLVVLYVIPVVVLLYFLRGPIADAFNAQGMAKDLIFLFCGPLSLAWIFNGIIFNSNAAYNNLGHPFYSTGINWGRNTLGIVPFVYLGAQLWGAEGVLIGQMGGGVFVAVVSYWLAVRIMNNAEKSEISESPESVFVKQSRLFKILNLRR